MLLRSVLFLLLLASASAAPLDDAVALYNAKKYPDARAALEKIAASDPANAAASYYLGQTLEHRGDNKALDDALPWLEKAAKLEPKNTEYLLGYGEVCLLLASNHTSVTLATKGRDTLETVVTLDPNNLDAREALLQYYDRAPWPLGSSSKAAAQLEEIRRRDPDRGTVLGAILKVNAKDYTGAFKICDDALAKNPADYVALYHYGRTASFSGQNIERGMQCLKKCLTLTPPGPAVPPHWSVWYRLGTLEEKLHHPAEARADYEEAFKLEPNSKQVNDALAKLKS